MDRELMLRRTGKLAALGLISAALQLLLTQPDSGYELWCAQAAAILVGMLAASFIRLGEAGTLWSAVAAYVMLWFAPPEASLTALAVFGFAVRQSDRHFPDSLSLIWLCPVLAALFIPEFRHQPLKHLPELSLGAACMFAFAATGFAALLRIMAFRLRSRMAYWLFLLLIPAALQLPSAIPVADPPSEKLTKLTLSYAALQLEPPIGNAYFWRWNQSDLLLVEDSGFFPDTAINYGASVVRMNFAPPCRLIVLQLPLNTPDATAGAIINRAVGLLAPSGGVLLAPARFNPLFPEGPQRSSPDGRWTLFFHRIAPVTDAKELESRMSGFEALGYASPIPLGVLELLIGEAAKGSAETVYADQVESPIPAMRQIWTALLGLAGYLIFRLWFSRHRRNLYGFISVERGFFFAATLLLTVDLLGNYNSFYPLFSPVLVLLTAIGGRRQMRAKSNPLRPIVATLFPAALLAAFIFRRHSSSVWEICLLAFMAAVSAIEQNAAQSEMYRKRLCAPTSGFRRWIAGALLGALAAWAAMTYGKEITLLALALGLKAIYILKL